MIGLQYKAKLENLLGTVDAQELINHLKNLEEKHADESLPDVEEIVTILGKKIPRLMSRYDGLIEKKKLHPIERLKILTYILKSFFHEQ